LDKKGSKIAVDFVSTGNNHHVAIYKDEKGNLHDEVVSFYEAVARVNVGQSVIWKEHPEHPNWSFQFTLKQNEYFIFPSEDFNPEEIDLLNPDNASIISPNLYRVQKIGQKDYWFRHHLETMLVDNSKTKGITWKRIQSISQMQKVVKVRINHLGQIVKVGE